MASSERSLGEDANEPHAVVPSPMPAHRLPALSDTDAPGIRGSSDGTGLRLAIACSRFNGEVTELLLAGAVAELERSGVAEEDRTVAWVPGAFELPLAARAMGRTGVFDAVICLGAVIRGETSHYDFVAGECASGLQRVQLEMDLPVVFGVLTTDNLEQAIARAGGARGHKGTEAAATAVEMANVLRRLADLGVRPLTGVRAGTLGAAGEAL